MIPQEPEELNPETAEESNPVTEPDLEKELAYFKKKSDDYLDAWKRSQADFINYKRRAEQDRMETGAYANTQLILKLLPILDDFERAFDAVAHKHSKADWVEGVKLVEKKFKKVLDSQGLTEITAVGEVFDPNIHEAIMHVKGEDGIVIQEFEKGYKLQDKIIRPSKVAVGNGEPQEDTKAESAKKEDKKE